MDLEEVFQQTMQLKLADSVLKAWNKKGMLQVLFVTWQALLIVNHELLLRRSQFYAVRGIISFWFVLPQETEGGI
jgi:hypothetical protein